MPSHVFRNVATGELAVVPFKGGHAEPEWESLGPISKSLVGTPLTVVDGKLVADSDAAWAALRAQRTRLLDASQWTAGRDTPDAIFERWAPYRRALRDLPQTTTDPFVVEWPTPPQ